MLKRLLLALLALTFGLHPLAAQTPGQWDVGQQPVTYPVVGADAVYTEGAAVPAEDGVPPFFGIQYADIPSTVTTQVVEGDVGNTTGNDEPKFRFTLHGQRLLADDPLRNHCDRGASHLHEFMGPLVMGACSTFPQLREDCIERNLAGELASTNPGDDVNCSGYWHPGLIEQNALGDGVDRTKKVLLVPLYYTVPGPATLTNTATYIDFPMGFGYVFGKNMDDPWNLRVKAEIAAANAAGAAAGGDGAAYTMFHDGYMGWHCFSPEGVQRQGLQADISLVDCQAGDTLSVQLVGPICADGRNLYSPSGYAHVRQAIQVSAIGGTRQDVCPNGWWKIPELVDKPQWVTHKAISSAVEGDEPVLSSDAMFQAKARADAGRCETVASSTVCAPADAASFVCKPGCSAHADYLQAWMKKYLRRAFRKCLGIPWTDTSETGLDADQTPFITACVDPTLSTSAGTESILANPLLVVPTREEVDGDEISDYYPTPLGHTGPHTMEDQ